MAEITSALVKELRERTGAGMMDCKRALAQVEGDLEAASDWLRKKGLAAAAKKSSRVTSEGLIGMTLTGAAGALVEVNAETDFVARNEPSRSWCAGSRRWRRRPRATSTRSRRRASRPPAGQSRTRSPRRSR